MAPLPVPPRPLSDAEHTVLKFILSAHFPGAALLRAQIAHTRVVAIWAPKLPSVDLDVPADAAAPAPVADGVIPVGAEVRDRAGRYVGEILVWVHDGRLAGIEYAWVTDEPPDRLPETGEMTLVGGA